MKKLIYLPGLIIISFALLSCNDDFLSGNKKDMYTLTDTLFITSDQQSIESTVQLPPTINSDFTIIMQPKWLSFGSMNGTIKNGIVPLTLTVIENNITNWNPGIYQTYYAHMILDVENTGLVSLTVAYAYYGSPTLQSSTSHLSYETSGSTQFTIRNVSEGILKWKITGAPDWLIFSVTSGSLYNGNSTTVTAFIDPAKVPQGQDLTGTFILESNSTTGNFTFQVDVLKEALILTEVNRITGIVTDAGFNHERGIMAICTKSPNSLILINTTTDESNIIPLEKTPVCVSLSEDGHKAAVGYSVAAVSYVDIDSIKITKDFTIDCIPFDIVLGDNDWCYITPLADQWVNFRNLNLNTGELVSIPSYNWSMMYEKTYMKKIPSQPYLVGTRTSLSPTGIVIYDITNGKANEITTYYHTTIGRFLISADATKLYDGYKNVYFMPVYDAQYHVSGPALFGQISSEFNTIAAMDECPALNSLFCTFSYYNYSSGTEETSPAIVQLNTTNLNKIRDLNASPVIVNENGINTIYETGVRYIFVNKEGSRVFAVKNLKESYSKDYWTIEIFKTGQ